MWANSSAGVNSPANLKSMDLFMFITTKELSCVLSTLLKFFLYSGYKGNFLLHALLITAP